MPKVRADSYISCGKLRLEFGGQITRWCAADYTMQARMLPMPGALDDFSRKFG
jgi:hypothetical protein